MELNDQYFRAPVAVAAATSLPWLDHRLRCDSFDRVRGCRRFGSKEAQAPLAFCSFRLLVVLSRSPTSTHKVYNLATQCEMHSLEGDKKSPTICIQRIDGRTAHARSLTPPLPVLHNCTLSGFSQSISRCVWQTGPSSGYSTRTCTSSFWED